MNFERPNIQESPIEKAYQEFVDVVPVEGFIWPAGERVSYQEKFADFGKMIVLAEGVIEEFPNLDP